MSLKNKSSIFDSADQFISHDPSEVRPASRISKHGAEHLQPHWNITRNVSRAI